MPRPSLKGQRSLEILDAYLTCVARFGLEGATQDRIASEAGVKRPLLRHYLGNKDDMIAALADHVVASFAHTTRDLAAHFATTGTPAELIEALFAEEQTHDPRLMLAYQALVTGAETYPAMRAPLLQSYADFLAVIESVLTRAHPGADPARIPAVAQGIAASVVSIDAMMPLSPPPSWRVDLKNAARVLADSLKDSR